MLIRYLVYIHKLHWNTTLYISLHILKRDSVCTTILFPIGLHASTKSVTFAVSHGEDVPAGKVEENHMENYLRCAWFRVWFLMQCLCFLCKYPGVVFCSCRRGVLKGNCVVFESYSCGQISFLFGVIFMDL